MIKSIKKQILRILYTGVTSSMSFSDRRKTIIINASGVLGGTSSFIMLFSNLYNHLYVLAILNVVTWIAGYAAIFLNTTRYRKTAPVAIGFIYSLAAAVSAVLYHNNVEYFLPLYVGVYFIVLDNIRTILLFSFFNIAMFLTISFNVIEVNHFEPVSETHRQLVIVNITALFLFFLYYFKKISQGYRIQMEKQNQELFVLNKNKERLFSILAHDIKSPVSSMLSAMKLLQEGILSHADLEILTATLYRQVSALHDNLCTILNWSKSQLQGMSVNPVPVELKPALHQALSLLQPQIEEKKLVIDDTGCSNETVWIDPDHLQLILRNLISNAVKFSYSAGRILIYTSVSPGSINLTIEDKGKGISETQAATLFDDFTFTTTYGTANEKGTGLGLKLCKEFILKNGGAISYAGREGEGAAFTVTIPQAFTGRLIKSQNHGMPARMALAISSAHII